MAVVLHEGRRRREPEMRTVIKEHTAEYKRKKQKEVEEAKKAEEKVKEEVKKVEKKVVRSPKKRSRSRRRRK